VDETDGLLQPSPKVDGIEVQFEVTVPTIRDRVVQTAAKLVLEPIFEADRDPAAYGYPIKAVHALLCRGAREAIHRATAEAETPSRRQTPGNCSSSPPSRRINCAILPGASYDPPSPTGC
jgi:hypothetical protein